MKILITGDWHITDKRPENRIDDYAESCFRKLRFIFDTVRKNDISTILQPGDFTDSPFMSYTLLIRLINFLNEYSDVDIFSLFGQHDLRYRTKENCVLSAIAAACKNVHLPDQRVRFETFKDNNVFISRSSYNESIPEVISEGFNILVLHKMIIQDKLWEGQTEFTPSLNFLRANKFDLICSGDNHQGFISDSKVLKKQLFNCGSLLRAKTDQINHQPFIVLYDTDTREYEKILIPIEPAENVFSLEKVVKEKEKNENLASFVTGLSESKEIGLKFEDNLNAYLNDNDIGHEIREIIDWAKIGNKDDRQ